MANDLRAIERLRRDLGLSAMDGRQMGLLLAAFEDQFGRAMPDDLVRYAEAPGLAVELALTWTAHVEFALVLHPATPEVAPGVDGPALWLMTENQGVCVWIVPVDAGNHPPVLVAGDNFDSPVVYAETLDDFADAWAWDAAMSSREPVLSAQAVELDAATEAYLTQRFSMVKGSRGWPTRRTIRLESATGLRILLWDDEGQCDWTISADDPAVLRDEVRRLLDYSDLRTSLYSVDDDGTGLLDELRSEDPQPRPHGG